MGPSDWWDFAYIPNKILFSVQKLLLGVANAKNLRLVASLPEGVGFESQEDILVKRHRHNSAEECFQISTVRSCTLPHKNLVHTFIMLFLNYSKNRADKTYIIQNFLILFSNMNPSVYISFKSSFNLHA